MYSKCEKGMLSSVKVFEGILAPRIISWTAMIAGFMQNGLNEDAVGLYRKMLRCGMKENEFSFASILPTQYSQSTWGQFKSYLLKQWRTYWGTAEYNLVRFFFTFAIALMLGSIF
ncbi:pleiotropic drug resistance [Thalictrum thalictroides]|uniref:Pleiotropic drug resistance n=1 Tax=Thalictrum thalictroides TaxID=46969 RepID=A0A7J6V918_THATH|nr:pleiotropic drug resistance [Thalictrum thalictroides]